MSQNNPRLLIAYAHPDDESFGLGGLIAKYVKQGVDVYLICATDGDVGTISPEHMQGHETVRDVRLAELRAANEILKFKDIFLFGYKDSGMMGMDSNQDPKSLWYAHEHCHDEVVHRVVKVIRDIRPQVVITFNKYGGYGHPDHIAIQRATTDAVQLAADAEYETGQQPYQIQKLYYSNIPKWSVQMWIWLSRLKGNNPRALGRNKDIDIVKILENVEPTHTRIDILDYYDEWDAASACHVSQGGGGGLRRFPKWWRRFIARYQDFTRIYPAPDRDKVDEYDMFDHVNPDD